MHALPKPSESCLLVASNPLITSYRACFTKALTIADDLSFQHAKPLVLALLGAYFHFTEPDQAKRMMQSCCVYMQCRVGAAE